RGRVAIVGRSSGGGAGGGGGGGGNGANGGIPLVHKALRAQAAGALAVVVVDDGACRERFGQHCVPGSAPPEGWASGDAAWPWQELHVPVVLVLGRDGARLRRVVRQR
ncbi:unnamed protein product, partial [Phaeothamnion confervicola]